MMQNFQSNRFVIPTEVEGSLDVARDYKDVNMDIRIDMHAIASLFERKSECLLNQNNRSSCLTRGSIKNRGFTLIELAIALMVIGLLIGGVLKGSELLDNARITRTVKDVQDYDTAVMMFRSTYNAIPGDIKRVSRIPNCTDVLCNVAGNGNGVITTGSGGVHDEAFYAWIHLARAGLISSVNENAVNYQSVSPEMPFGEGHHISLQALSAHIQPAEAGAYDPYKNRFILQGRSYNNVNNISKIDHKMDDGKPYGGDVQLYVYSTSGDCHDPVTMDYLQDESLTCRVRIFSRSAN